MNVVPTSDHPLVDTKSWDLAEHFLPADAPERDKWALADVIQRAVEDWFEYREILAEKQKRFTEIRTKLAIEADGTDADIMVWAQRHPRVCGSNMPTGEFIQYGGRRQV